MGSKRNILALLLAALLAVILLPSATVGAQTGTLIVPDQYPTIQAAIDSASAGDTVLVKAGTYSLSGTILINKPLSLIGENASTTIIDQNGGHSIWVKADNVTVSGFTIQNYNCGITVGSGYGYPEIDNTALNCHIQGNKLLNGNSGICVDGGIGFSIANNTILNNRECGIYLYPTAIDGAVTGNCISHNGWQTITGIASGIGLNSAKNITLAGNNLTANYQGIDLQFATVVNIHGNNITDSHETGIIFGQFCGNVSVYENNLTRNAVANGLIGFFDPSLNDRYAIGSVSYWRSLNYSNNFVYRNNFFDNSKQVICMFPDWDIGYNITDVVSWDNGTIGNFWSDYQSKYPNATELGISGIGNLPYVIDANNTDHFPLMKQVVVLTPTPFSNAQSTMGSQPASDFSNFLIIASIFSAVSIIAIFLLLFRRHGRSAPYSFI
jgi:parallel beta-helix repeat protein